MARTLLGVSTQARVVVISPHLDDAALSVGASVSHAARLGASITFLTVLAGDPDSGAPAGPWDRECGFATLGEAARGRRQEDERACRILGAVPRWLPYPDEQYARSQADDEIVHAVEAEVGDADLVLLPGYPLNQPDHVWLTALLAPRLSRGSRLGFYVEQPYASWIRLKGGGARGVLGAAEMVMRRWRNGDALGTRPYPVSSQPGLEWRRSTPRASAWLAKRSAIRAYASQLNGLGRHLAGRILLYDAASGGEELALPARAG